MGPLPYVALKAQFGAATPLVHFLEASGQPTYTCAIVSTNAKTRLLKSLKGVKVALTQPLSTCGIRATDGLLQQAGNTLMAQQYRYLNQHADAVALAVASGEFELGGIKTAIARQYAHVACKWWPKPHLRPSFALIANGQKLSPQRQQTLRQVLTSLSPLNNPADRSITQSWGNNLRHGAVNASDADYEIGARSCAAALASQNTVISNPSSRMIWNRRHWGLLAAFALLEAVAVGWNYRNWQDKEARYLNQYSSSLQVTYRPSAPTCTG